MRRVLGAIMVVVGAAAIALGSLGAYSFGPEGRLDSSSSALESARGSHALVADILRIDAGFPGSSSLGEVTIGAEAVGGKPLFIGYGTARTVNRYLDGVGFDAVAQSGADWQTQTVPGVTAPADPAEQDFWLGSSSGFDAEVAFKIPSSGEASLVVMNLDASAPVSARIAIGYKSQWVFPLALTVIGVGAVLVILGVWALWPRRRRSAVDQPAAPASSVAEDGGKGGEPPEDGGDAAQGDSPQGDATAGDTAPESGDPGTEQQERRTGPVDWFQQESSER